jgi:NhaP-type Na+/H+ or K+/H+ antiporter
LNISQQMSFNPIRWGNMDMVLLECTRIVLMVQCFAVAVELRKQHVERHRKSLIGFSVQ